MKKDIKKTEVIEYIGLNKLDPVEQDMVKKIVDEYSYKVRRKLHNYTSLIVHIKTHSKGGHKDRYELSVRAIAPTRRFEVGKIEEWELPVALHKAFDGLIHEIEHAFKE